MLLAIDVGNTNITTGVFKDETLIARFRITTKLPRTSDEFGLLISDLLFHKGIRTKEIDDIIISSVVPDIMHSMNNAIIKEFQKKPIIVGPGIKTGIKPVTGNPYEIGSARIADAAGAFEIYGGPIIVIDFGTATTYDFINEKGEFAAGITSPGIRICAKALSEEAARLPNIEIKKPKSILAKDTITSMQAGLVYGYIGQTEYIIDKIKEESGLSNIQTVATGGLGKIIAEETKKIDIYDVNLTMNGLRIIYNKNK